MQIVNRKTLVRRSRSPAPTADDHRRWAQQLRQADQLLRDLLLDPAFQIAYRMNGRSRILHQLRKPVQQLKSDLDDDWFREAHGHQSPYYGPARPR